MNEVIGLESERVLFISFENIQSDVCCRPYCNGIQLNCSVGHNVRNPRGQGPHFDVIFE